MLGVVMGDHFKDPVLLVKVAWSGKDLFCDFRPPSSGKPAYQIPQRNNKDRDMGDFYRKLIKEVHYCLDNMGTHFPKLKGVSHDICGFVWFQGWNEMYAGKGIQDKVSAEYPSNFTHLLQDLRKEFIEPNLPAVVDEQGCGGVNAKDNMLKLRHAQMKAAKVAIPRGSALFIPTAKYWDRETDALFHEMNKVKGKLAKDLRASIKLKIAAKLKGKDKKQQQRILSNATNKAVMKKVEYKAIEAKWQMVGNWQCHDHGSGKIYCLIGHALAEGMKRVMK